MYKKLFENKKLVVFDMDGTLVDTEAFWYEALKRVLDSLSFEWASAESPVGMNLIDRWIFLIDRLKIETNLTAKDLAVHTKTKFLDMLNESDLETREGFWPLAAQLKEDLGMKLALVSNSDKVIMDGVLHKLGIAATFDFVISAQDVKRPKPAADIYLEALKQAGFKAKDALVFEDSVIGATASVAAKIDTVVIWDAVIPMNFYPEGILDFTEDFEQFVGNLTTDVVDQFIKNTMDLQDEELVGS